MPTICPSHSLWVYSMRKRSPFWSVKKLMLHWYMSARFIISAGDAPASIMSFHSELLIVTSALLRTCSTGLS